MAPSVWALTVRNPDDPLGAVKLENLRAEESSCVAGSELLISVLRVSAIDSGACSGKPRGRRGRGDCSAADTLRRRAIQTNQARKVDVDHPLRRESGDPARFAPGRRFAAVSYLIFLRRY